MLLWTVGVVLLVPAVLADSRPEVRLAGGGVLRGTYQTTLKGRKIAAFLGVPYAKPPLRFKMAEPVEPWEGVREATKIQPDCLQYSELTFKTQGSEDCLYANVYVPQFPQSHSNLLDVIIYIHGGGFSFKIGDFGPKYILEHDVVFVFFNYRLGSLGFLSTGDDVIPGNFGLKDQTMLLRWVRDNIKYFGGNPNRVLLTGTSAGGASVHYHLLSPMSRGLIHRAFSMSGSSLCCWTQSEKNKEKAEFVAKNLGCPIGSSQEILNCLLTKDGHAIAEQLGKLQKWDYFPFSPFGPVVEPESPNAFISKYPSEIIRDGEAMDIPWLTTINSEEGLYPVAVFVANKTAMNRLDNEWNELVPSLLDYEHTTTLFPKEKVSQRIRDKYIGNRSVSDNIPGLIKMCSDRLFVDCMVEAANLHVARYKSPVYSYMFSYRGTSSGTEFLTKTKTNYGVCHGDDTGYIFENIVVYVEGSERDKRMVELMTELVVNFAATGKPSFKGLKDWPQINDNYFYTYVNIKDPDTYEIVSSPKLGEHNFWSSLKFAEDS